MALRHATLCCARRGRRGQASSAPDSKAQSLETYRDRIASCPVAIEAPRRHKSSDEGYGFLETRDGRELYFHSISVLNGDFDRWEIGSKVRFAGEEGEKRPQARRSRGEAARVIPLRKLKRREARGSVRIGSWFTPFAFAGKGKTVRFSGGFGLNSDLSRATSGRSRLNRVGKRGREEGESNGTGVIPA